ncbi:MAG: TnpV protein [Oscillospiraceae bacterium]|nr:TnpV protein [Oscillospiraceae bacterium]
MKNISFHRSGDYYLPDLIAPESPRIGIWGYCRREYLRKYKNPIYTGLFLTGKLNAHLEDVDRQANELFDRLIKEYAAREGVTEELKARNQLEWVAKINAIRERVEEVIFSELIYA